MKETGQIFDWEIYTARAFLNICVSAETNAQKMVQQIEYWITHQIVGEPITLSYFPITEEPLKTFFHHNHGKELENYFNNPTDIVLLTVEKGSFPPQKMFVSLDSLLNGLIDLNIHHVQDEKVIIVSCYPQDYSEKILMPKRMETREQ